MKSDKVSKFMALAGQTKAGSFHPGSSEMRKLGAQLLLSEVLEYVIDGLGITPEVNGMPITDPNALLYRDYKDSPDQTSMLDGLADVAYTMYWNALAFGLPLDEAYDIVCDNNLSKFVRLARWAEGKTELALPEWHCYQDVEWPDEVVRVEVINHQGELYAVGKDSRGKVRKPSTHQAVSFGKLVGNI